MERKIRFCIPGNERPVTRSWAARPENNIPCIQPAHLVPLPPRRKSRKHHLASILRSDGSAQVARASSDAGCGRFSIRLVVCADLTVNEVKIICSEIMKQDPEVIALCGVQHRDRAQLEKLLKDNSYDGYMMARKDGSLYEGLLINKRLMKAMSSQGVYLEDESLKEAAKGGRDVTVRTNAALLIFVAQLTGTSRCVKLALVTPSQTSVQTDVKDLVLKKVLAVRRKDVLATVVIGLASGASHAAGMPDNIWYTTDKVQVVAGIPSIPSALGDVDRLPTPVLTQTTFEFADAPPTVRRSKRNRSSENGEDQAVQQDATTAERCDEDVQSAQRRVTRSRRR